MAKRRSPELEALVDRLGGGPVVSVIVTAWNEGRFIRPCLRSVREQWFRELECVIVDDGSDDETTATAQEFADKDERFVLVRHDERRGLAAARNSGLERASAPYVTFLDGDDFLYPHSIRGRIEPLLEVEDDRVVGTYCDWQTTREKEGRTPPTRDPAAHTSVVSFLDGPECPFIATAPLLNRRVVEDHGGFDEALSTAEDFDLWVRILRNGHTFHYVPWIGVAYRQKASGMVFTGTADHADAATEIIAGQYLDRTAEPNPPFFAKSLAQYQQDAAIAARVLRSFAIADATGDKDASEAIRALLPDTTRALVGRGLDPALHLRAGLARAARAIEDLRNPAVRDERVATLVGVLDLG